MRYLLATLLLTALPAWAAPAQQGCARLCGEWTLDVAHSDQPGQIVDAALENYKDPRPRYQQRRQPRDAVESVVAEMERDIGPIYDRPDRDGVKAELVSRITPASSLAFGARGAQILLRADGGHERRFEAERPHSRTDSLGTAKIRTTWKGQSLVITETYDRKHGHKESYTLQPDGSLLLTREFQRPGLKNSIVIRAVYRQG